MSPREAESRHLERQFGPWEIERDRFGVMFSGPLEVGECIEVVPLDDSFIGLLRVAETIMDRHYPADIFNAANPIVGADSGTQLVVALRAVKEAMTSG